MFGSLSAPRRRLALIMIGLVLVSIIALVAAMIIRGLARPVGPAPQDQPGPVLLVPGYGGRVASLDPLAAALRQAGRTVVVVERLGDGTGDLRGRGRAPGPRWRDQALADTGAPSVDVIGYSAGGVVARLWVRDHGGAARARRVLTLGSPHHGTSQAALGRELAGGCPTACEQLVPDSDLLRRLNAGDETPDGPLWVTVRSELRPGRDAGRLRRAGRRAQRAGPGRLSRVDGRARRAARGSGQPGGALASVLGRRRRPRPAVPSRRRLDSCLSR